MTGRGPAQASSRPASAARCLGPGRLRVQTMQEVSKSRVAGWSVRSARLRVLAPRSLTEAVHRLPLVPCNGGATRRPRRVIERGRPPWRSASRGRRGARSPGGRLNTLQVRSRQSDHGAGSRSAGLPELLHQRGRQRHAVPAAMLARTCAGLRIPESPWPPGIAQDEAGASSRDVMPGERPFLERLDAPQGLRPVLGPVSGPEVSTQATSTPRSELLLGSPRRTVRGR
jgi:hypothetical protein